MMKDEYINKFNRFYDKMKQFLSSIYMKSFVIAISYWLIIYVIVGTSFMIIKWNSTDQTIIINPSLTTNDEVSSLPNNININNEQHELIQKYINTIQHEIHVKHQEIDHIHQQQKRINDAIQSFRTIQNRLISLNNNINDNNEEEKKIEDSEVEEDNKKLDNNNNNQIQPKTLKLRQLLSIILESKDTELRSLNQFTKYMNSATDEIQKNIEYIMSSLTLYYKNNYNDPNIMFPIVNWPIYTNLLHININKKKKKHDNDDDDSMFADDNNGGGGCANPYLTTSSTSNSIYVTIDDFERTIETIKSTLLLPFSNVTESVTLPFLLPDMMKQLEQLIYDSIEHYRMMMKQDNVVIDESEEDNVMINENDDERTVSCLLNVNDVDSWIDTGLDAMYRHKDIGDAIMNVIQQQNIPFDIESYYKQYPNHNKDNNNNKRINLKINTMKTNTNNKKQIQWKMSEIKNIRRLIDIPMIHILISYFDILIDKISGQNDIIDDILEKYIWSQISDDHLDDHDIIAKTFIQTIFPLIGQYNISIPIPIMN